MCCVDAVMRGSGKRGCLDSPHTTKLGCRTDSFTQRTKYLKIYDTIFCLSNTVFIVCCTFGSVLSREFSCEKQNRLLYWLPVA